MQVTSPVDQSRASAQQPRARMLIFRGFHLVSLSFANFPGRGVVVLVFVGGCVFGFVFVVFCFASRETSASN